MSYFPPIFYFEIFEEVEKGTKDFTTNLPTR